jgi:hypothetical protein
MRTKTGVAKLPVSTRALVQRLNRKLHDDELEVRKTRGGRARLELGEFYLLNWRLPNIVQSHVDLEELGRKEGVLAVWERWDDPAG